MKIITIIILVLTLAGVISAQDTDLNPKVELLRAKLNGSVTKEGLDMILELGNSGDKTTIPYLQKLAALNASKYDLNSVSSFAQIALVKLGETKFLVEIVNQINDKDFTIQDNAIEKLGLIGDKDSYKTLYSLLDDVNYRQEIPTDEQIKYARENGLRLHIGDHVLVPKSFKAMEVLSKTVTNPPVSCKTEPTETHIKLWKEWFAKHKELIE